MTAPTRESSLGISKPQTITVKPDFVLIRNSPRGAIPSTDERNVLFGLMHARVPSINSFQSIYMCLERPIMFSALCEIEQRLGHDTFPLIDQIYYSSHHQLVISPEFPCVIKVGHAHGGYGKTLVNDSQQFQDVGSLLALNNNYCTGEEFIEVDYGLRIQKIGNHLRVMKKVYTRSGWKTQYGGSFMEDIPVTPKYKLWADECSKCFGGLDIFALDALHGVDGKDYVIELNDSMMGLAPEHWREDSAILRDLVLDRMDAIYVKEEVPRPVFVQNEQFDSKPEREYRGERPSVYHRRTKRWEEYDEEEEEEEENEERRPRVMKIKPKTSRWWCAVL
eukprot:Phypoly_transcript_10786.p1 GENE.Phypoly_transcript_10786~~Phypoly_transcript_10786.p1  ORF type:complete len:393 (+),score=56.97 Phypoly_transcript_10786:176-1180(+)